MKYIGAHVSIAGGIEQAPLRAAALGANAFAIFTKNQRQWKAKPLEATTIAAFQKNLLEARIQPEHVLVHDGYLINLGNPDKEKRSKSLDLFILEAQRVEQLGLQLLNFHPGSHLRLITEEECLKLIADGIRQGLQATEEIIFVLETTAGQGSNMGYRFEQLARLIELVGDSSRIGVCIDTCHIYTAGYDIKESYQEVMNAFDSIIGRTFLKGVHLNDSKSTCGQRLDRHQSLGKGELGWKVFENIMADPMFENIPLILETIDQDLWPAEIERLRQFEPV